MTETDRKLYTVEEANRTLPLVRSIVGDIVDLYHDVHARKERLNNVRQLRGASSRDNDSVYSEELEQMEREIDGDIERLKEYAAELDGLGIELKDPITGLIDFYSEMDGRIVYLCWKMGEQEVAHWHELDAGFAGRQSLFEDAISGGPDASSEIG